MISRIWEAVFTPKYPKGYTGRHRAGSVVTGNMSEAIREDAV
jgi:hypothetical protein